METVTDFILGDSKITADGDCSHEIKKVLAPWKKLYDQTRQHIKKQRHYFANKGLSSQNYGFPVVMYVCESWTIKKAECRRIDAFELWCWRRLLRVLGLQGDPTLEGLMLKLKLQYLMRRTDTLKKTLMLGKIEGGRIRRRQDEIVEWHH